MAMTSDGAGANSHNEWIKVFCAVAANAPFWVLWLWGTVKLGKIDAGRSGGVSEGVAMIVGMLEVSFGLTAAAVRASARFIADTDESDELRHEGPALLLGAGALVAAGSSLILLSIAGPGRLVPPTWGLVVVMLLGILATVFLTMRLRVLDELNRAVARESGHLAFEWLSIVGGTWAILTHLGFVPAPTPLNWLTMLYGFGFLAGIVASARRGGFDNVNR